MFVFKPIARNIFVSTGNMFLMGHAFPEKFNWGTGTITTIGATGDSTSTSLTSGALGSNMYSFSDGSGSSITAFNGSSNSVQLATRDVTLTGTRASKLGTKLFLYGGANGIDTTKYVRSYDGTTYSSEGTTGMSEYLQRSGVGYYPLADRNYIYGGYNGTVWASGNVLSHDGSTFTAKAAMVIATKDRGCGDGAVCSVDGNQAVHFGGFENADISASNSYTNRITGHQNLTDTYLTWGVSLYNYKSKCAAVYTGSNAYIFGGIGGTGSTNYSTIQKLTPGGVISNESATLSAAGAKVGGIIQVPTSTLV